jgi:hypothetical protein
MCEADKWALADKERGEDLCGDALKKVWPGANSAAILYGSNGFMC